MKHYEIHTYTLADGYVNTWLTVSDQPVTFDTYAQALKALRDYYADGDDAVLGGEICDYERDLKIVEVITGNEHVHPIMREALKCLR